MRFSLAAPFAGPGVDIRFLHAIQSLTKCRLSKSCAVFDLAVSVGADLRVRNDFFFFFELLHAIRLLIAMYLTSATRRHLPFCCPSLFWFSCGCSIAGDCMRVRC